VEIVVVFENFPKFSVEISVAFCHQTNQMDSLCTVWQGIPAAVPATSFLRYKCDLSVDIPISSECETSFGR